MSQDNQTTRRRPQRGGAQGGPGGGHGMMAGVEKPKNFKATLRKLIKELSQYKVRIIIVFIFAALSAFLMILGPKILGKTIGRTEYRLSAIPLRGAPPASCASVPETCRRTDTRPPSPAP